MTRLLSLTIVIFIFALSCKSPNETKAQSDHKYTNQLINQSSPYLLQHAHNPVDWHPWGEEALKKAKDENKMLLISVGYSACHWCHVMEHESFEDTTVAKIMNDNFVCIKVDREERPDVDAVYMNACQLATGRGCGWPLNAFALPNGQPIWAGTYYPKKEWVDVLEYFINIKKEEPERLQEYAQQITQGIQQSESMSFRDGDQLFSKEKLQLLGDQFISTLDMTKGGRKNTEMKFPMPNIFEFLLSYFHYSKNPMALDAAEVTLDKMANGGIYDHLGGGFSRYTTDPNWHVPHFEKMLYDNSQLVSLYSKAYQVSKNELYKNVVVESLQFIDRELTDNTGGFYSSLDADSEGEEGKFYVWTYEEVQSIINDEKVFEAFAKYYDLKKGGNWEHNKNILQVKKSMEEVAKKLDGLKGESDPVGTLQKHLAKAKASLFAERQKRIRPGLDDKILTSWNALMLRGYVDAYRAFGKEEYLAKALKNAQFLSKEMMQKDFRLNRNYKDGKSVINAFLDDYAFLANAFVSLYQVTFDTQWLDKAKGLTDYAIQHFYDENDKMFNYTSDIDPPLIARKKETTDKAIPASNSEMARALYQLGIYFYDESYLTKAKQMLFNMEQEIIGQEQPSFYSNWCQLYIDVVQPPYEVAIVGKDYEAKLKTMIRNFTPNAILLGGATEGELALLKNKLQEGETMIYVCQDKICKFPVSEVNKALELME